MLSYIKKYKNNNSFNFDHNIKYYTVYILYIKLNRYTYHEKIPGQIG